MRVALSYYFRGGEDTSWEDMAAVPARDDRLYRPPYSEDVPLQVFWVKQVVWQRDDQGWFPEVTLADYPPQS